MKAKDIFLTITAIILSGIGYAASRAITFTHPYYYYINAYNQCILVSIPTVCTRNAINPPCTTYDENNTPKIIFGRRTFALPTGCIEPLVRI